MTRSKPPERKRRAALRRLLGDARGGITVVAALVVPALALLTCGAIDLAAVNADHSAMQDAADATALAMAKQLGVATQHGHHRPRAGLCDRPAGADRQPATR